MTNDQAITNAARQVATAFARQQQAVEEVSKAQDARARIAERVATLDGQRAEIVARHRAGNRHADDAGRLSLLEVDREDLNALLADADSTVAAAQGAVQNAGHVLASARHGLQQIENEAAEAALIEHATKLDALLHTTMSQIAELRLPLGRTQPSWRPSSELWGDLRKIQAAVGKL